jgi:hypothetical protein
VDLINTARGMTSMLVVLAIQDTIPQMTARLVNAEVFVFIVVLAKESWLNLTANKYI